jgi:predicted RNA-binding protein with PUA-like domain
MPESRSRNTIKAPPATWLFKSEPETWSWDQQLAAGAAGTEWNGVRNALAQKHMKAMRVGDLGFFYHSVTGKCIAGVVKVIREAHPDSTDPEQRWHCVDVAAVKALPRPVTLAEIKNDPVLQNQVLVKNSRLSVQPVTPEEWQHILQLGGLKL